MVEVFWWCPKHTSATSLVSLLSLLIKFVTQYLFKLKNWLGILEIKIVKKQFVSFTHRLLSLRCLNSIANIHFPICSIRQMDFCSDPICICRCRIPAIFDPCGRHSYTSDFLKYFVAHSMAVDADWLRLMELQLIGISQFQRRTQF